MASTSASPAGDIDRDAAIAARWFDPQAIAIIGASPRPGNAGASYVRALREYKGVVSVVHPQGAPVFDVPGHRRVEDLPDVPDLAIVAVPAAQVVETMEALGRVGCRAVHVFTGGFAELGTDAAATLQEGACRVALDFGIDLLGPNCMGIHRPAAGLSFRSDLPLLAGPVGVVSQSGGIAINLVQLLAQRAIGTSAVVSFGNGAHRGPAWWCEAIAGLPETGPLVLYVESSGEPDLLMRLEDLARKRTVLVLRPEADAASLRAARRHTGAPGGETIPEFDGAGVLVAGDLIELCDRLELELVFGRHRSRNIVFTSISGGAGVLAAGELARAGRPLAPLPDDVRLTVESLEPSGLVAAGNPIDLGPRFLSLRLLSSAIEVVDAGGSDALHVVHVPWDAVQELDSVRPGYADRFVETLGGIATSHAVVAYFPHLGFHGEDEGRQNLRRAGVPVISTLGSLGVVTSPTGSR